MPSRMIHYLVAERVGEQIPIRDKNRFKIGSICPDMSWRMDDSKHRTHYSESDGPVKGINWRRFVERYEDKMRRDDFYFGVLCHLITDGVWFHEIMEPFIRSKVKNKEERQKKYQEGYLDFHRLNYILREEFGLTYELTEDRNIELDGLHHEFYEASISCIELCIAECVKEIQAFREGMPMGEPRNYYVPVRE